MNVASLHIDQRVRHPGYGLGTIKAVTEHTAEVAFDDGTRRSVAPEASGLEPAEAHTAIAGLEMPLAQIIRDTVTATVAALGLERPGTAAGRLATRWHKGRLVLHPADPAAPTKEVELEVFFHKIVMMRDKLRVLEQKVNAHPKLADAEKVELQQYITGIYGSMTTFNILFREKEDQF
jgi:hypothetical protein